MKIDPILKYSILADEYVKGNHPTLCYGLHESKESLKNASRVAIYAMRVEDRSNNGEIIFNGEVVCDFYNEERKQELIKAMETCAKYHVEKDVAMKLSISAYEVMKDALFRHHSGKYALIYKNTLEGIFDDKYEAYKFGDEKFRRGGDFPGYLVEHLSGD